MLVVTEVVSIASEKVTEMLVLIETPLWLSVGETEETVGAVVSCTVVKVALAAVIELPALSSTVEPMDMYTACELGRLLGGLIVMTSLLASMVAPKVILAPLALVNFSVMRLSTLLFVNSVLSMLRTASLRVMVMLSLMVTPVAPFAGLNVTVGAM